MKGILFDDFEVELDDRMLDPIGGAWQGPLVDGKLTAWDSDVLRFFWEAMCEVDKPLVLDIGASTGSFCLLAKFVVTERMIAFEPNPVAFDLLKSNVHLNDLDSRVFLVPWAIVGDDVPRAMLKVPSRRNAGFATIGQPKRFSKWEQVYYPRTERLDDIVFPRVDLIKIDTEGCELGVLLGGEDTIQAWRPSILMEYEPRNTAQFGYKPQELVDLLKSWGYQHFERVGKEDMWATA